MTAGGGILHKEAPPEEVVAVGGTFHGIQLWVNLPSRLKMTAPRYQDIRGGEVALLTNHDGGALLRRHRRRRRRPPGPRRHPHPDRPPPRHRPARRRASACPWQPDFNALVYAMSGAGTVGPDGRPFGPGQLAVLGAGDVVTVRADAHRTAHARPRGARPRRAADRRAGGGLRPLRDEHPRRAPAGLRRLQRRPPRPGPPSPSRSPDPRSAGGASMRASGLATVPNRRSAPAAQSARASSTSAQDRATKFHHMSGSASKGAPPSSRARGPERLEVDPRPPVPR